MEVYEGRILLTEEVWNRAGGRTGGRTAWLPTLYLAMEPLLLYRANRRGKPTAAAEDWPPPANGSG